MNDLPPDPHRLPAPTDWFAPDAERHLLDKPKHCPMCGAAIDISSGIVTEFWQGTDRVFMTWCSACSWFGEVVFYTRGVTITEAEH